MKKALEYSAALGRARKRGGTASMIISAVSNDLKISNLRADSPAIMRAFNERFEFLAYQRDALLEALKAQRDADMALGGDVEFSVWTRMERKAKKLQAQAFTKAEESI